MKKMTGFETVMSYLLLEFDCISNSDNLFKYDNKFMFTTQSVFNILVARH